MGLPPPDQQMSGRTVQRFNSVKSASDASPAPPPPGATVIQPAKSRHKHKKR
jgi:hypothetical protein